MNEVEKINILREVGAVELDKRLRNVGLKGFPDVKIYEDADIEIKEVSGDWLRENVFVPQPTVYGKGYLDRIEKLAGLFRGQGVDIFHLNQGYDYVATDSGGEETQWTIIPPVVEAISLRFVPGGGLDYSMSVGSRLRDIMKEQGHELNPELEKLDFKVYKNFQGRGVCSVPIICDGSHRVHNGLEGKAQNLLWIDGIKPGFPYYAAPKPYSEVHVEEERPEGGGSDKTHVLTEPGHKLLYRLFPSGGILSGSLRPGKK